MARAGLDPRTLEGFSDWRWRLNTLYRIKDAKGRSIPFRMNWAQEALARELHTLNIVLKARQLGFTTFIQLMMLDACLFNPDIAAGTIAHKLEDAEEIFANKIKYAYEALAEGIRAAVPAKQDSARKLSFANGSAIRVGLSLRSGTFQYLHISEHGQICARYPEKAREIRTGALNTVQAGQMIFVESTAEGREGDFHDFCRAAQRLALQGAALTPLDFKLHFFPWWRHPDYALDPAGVVVPAEDATYFERLQAENGVVLSPQQRAWYVKKKAQQGEHMLKEFPSTVDEAFQASVEGAYYARELGRLRQGKQIARVPHEPTVPVNTFWDLGIDDHTAIWFHQRVGRENRFIDFAEGRGEGLAHYARLLRDKPYVYGTHYLPHDVEVRSLSTGKSRKQTLFGLGVRPLVVVPRTDDVADDIQAARNVLATCWFDAEACDRGLKALEAYRKDWDDKLGTFTSRPRHDWAAHAADAFRCFAVGYRGGGNGWRGLLTYDNRGIV